MSLGAFLEDTSLGSWADEMDALPTAPAIRTDEEKARIDRGFDRGGRDYGSRLERAQPQREELPLPTEPPYTAFVGNLPYDLTEEELSQFFTPSVTKSVKVIKDRDDRPKGFGYVEFADLDGLKEALEKSGSLFQNRPIRVSVASPQQSKFAGEDDKFDGPWRRDGPLPAKNDFRSSRFDDGPGSRFREEKPSSVSGTASDWRSSRAPPPRFDDGPRPPRKSGMATPTGEPSPADLADTWTRGAKFTPAPTDAPPRGRFGSLRSDRGELSAPSSRREPSNVDDTGDWRSVMRPNRSDSQDKSPSTSTPPTPQLGRRKLELAPRTTSGGNSAAESPLASPKMRSNPFGAAKPVDVSARENEVAERLQKDRENLAKTVAEKTPMGRTPSKTAREREPVTILQPPSTKGSTPSSPTKATPQTSVVRPSFSFANAAGGSKKNEEAESEPALPSAADVIEEEKTTTETPVDDVTAQVEDMVV